MGSQRDVPHNQYLQKRGQTWYVRVIVPPSLREKIGKQHILRSLKTRDVAEAREKRWEAVAEITRHFRELRGPAAWDPVKLGLEHRQRYRQASPELESPDEDPSNDNLSERDDVHHQITIDVDELRDAGRRKDAALLYKVATAEAECVLKDAEKLWLADIAESQTDRSVTMHRGVLAELCAAYPEAVFASDIDRKKAGEFTSIHLLGKGLSQATVNRKLWSLSSFWDWMGRRGLIEEGVNPWKRQGDHSKKRAKRAIKEGRDTQKRPFTAEELVALLGADPREHSGGRYSSEISDLMRLGLVTGCRIEELCGLRVADVKVPEQAIFIRHGKTENAERTIPILDVAWGIIERRLSEAPKGGPGGVDNAVRAQAYLMPKLKLRGKDEKRAAYMTKVFTRLRRSVLGDTGEVAMASGRQKSPVDYHSFRRTFATYLEHAMTKTVAVNPTVIAELMGHEKGTLALSVYSGGLRIEHLRKAIDAMGEAMEPEVLKLVQGTMPSTSARPIGEVSASTA